MDKSILMYRGGVRTAKRKLVDGNEHDLFYKARTPAEVAGFRGAVASFESNAAGFVARDKFLGKFLVGAMCNEDGTQLLTSEEAANIPDTLKLELSLLIINGSGEAGDAGKD